MGIALSPTSYILLLCRKLIFIYIFVISGKNVSKIKTSTVFVREFLPKLWRLMHAWNCDQAAVTGTFTSWDIEAESKWPQICKHFVIWFILYLYSNFFMACSWRSSWQKSPHVVACHRTGDKQLHKPMMTKFFDILFFNIIWCHYATISLWVLNQCNNNLDIKVHTWLDKVSCIFVPLGLTIITFIKFL